MDWLDWAASEWWDWLHFWESWQSFVRFVMLILGIGLIAAGVSKNLGNAAALNGIGAAGGAILIISSITWSILAFRNGD